MQSRVCGHGAAWASSVARQVHKCREAEPKQEPLKLLQGQQQHPPRMVNRFTTSSWYSKGTSLKLAACDGWCMALAACAKPEGRPTNLLTRLQRYGLLERPTAPFKPAQPTCTTGHTASSALKVGQKSLRSFAAISGRPPPSRTVI